MKHIAYRLTPAVLVLTAGLPLSASAQSVAPERAIVDDLIQCLAVEDDQRRLDCYDARLRQVTNLSADEASEAAQTFQGSGNWQSETFVIDAPWRLAWQTNTDLLTIQLSGPTPLQIETVADNQIGNSAGQSELQQPGEYSLTVRAIGTWHIFAVEE